MITSTLVDSFTKMNSALDSYENANSEYKNTSGKYTGEAGYQLADKEATASAQKNAGTAATGAASSATASSLRATRSAGNSRGKASSEATAAGASTAGQTYGNAFNSNYSAALSSANQNNANAVSAAQNNVNNAANWYQTQQNRFNGAMTAGAKVLGTAVGAAVNAENGGVIKAENGAVISEAPTYNPSEIAAKQSEENEKAMDSLRDAIGKAQDVYDEKKNKESAKKAADREKLPGIDEADKSLNGGSTEDTSASTKTGDVVEISNKELNKALSAAMAVGGVARKIKSSGYTSKQRTNDKLTADILISLLKRGRIA